MIKILMKMKAFVYIYEEFYIYLTFLHTAYRDKVKELPLVSLLCSCINSNNAENPTYKAEGKYK